MTCAGCWQRIAVVALGLLPLTPLAWGQADKGGKTAKEVEKAQEVAFAKVVNAAIDRGIAYLRSTQGTDGTWPRQEHRSGATALAGLALLEGGVPGNDKAITQAAAALRAAAFRETQVYSISAIILFLDKLGDPQDVPFIEALAVRLLAGQHRGADGGGWSYTTPAPGQAELTRLAAALKNRKPWAPPKGGVPVEAKKPRTLKDLPKEVQAEIDLIMRGPGFGMGAVDLSNTQFALIALWVARRHGIPVENAYAFVEHRLRRLQLQNGGWGYLENKAGPAMAMMAPDTRATPQMTCAALMGLAMAYAANPSLRGVKRDMTRDPAVRAGFQALIPVIGDPKGVESAPVLSQRAANRVYYTLWTLERMAVLFDFKRLGGKDWYKWGAEILLRNQQGNGSWLGAYADGGADTCFALLFLKRANLAADLTAKLRKDPSRPKLQEMIQDTEGSKLKSDLKLPRGPGGRQSRLAPPADLHRPMGAVVDRSCLRVSRTCLALPRCAVRGKPEAVAQARRAWPV
jgi:hypothetical protein